MITKRNFALHACAVIFLVGLCIALNVSDMIKTKKKETKNDKIN